MFVLCGIEELENRDEGAGILGEVFLSINVPERTKKVKDTSGFLKTPPSHTLHPF